MAPKSAIGVIGLGVMGANLARNLASKGFHTAVFNRTPERATHFIKSFGTEFLHNFTALSDFIADLYTPRKVLLMVQSGAAVDAVLQDIIPFLAPGDIVIDGGNSLWSETERRATELQMQHIHFFGCGVSGGEEGALHGPSLMPGGMEAVYTAELAPLFTKIAAKDFSGKPCVSLIGPDGAGHYVKMVHNGIEYAVMQVLAEAYDLLRKAYGLKADEIAQIFEKLHAGKLESFLTEISVKVLQQKDDLDSGFLIDRILDKAGQKGTGKWTVADALERGVSVPSIAAAVDARVVSGQKALRQQLAAINLHAPKEAEQLPLGELTKKLEGALYAALLSIYAQGYALIIAASVEQKWNIDLAELSRIWQGGCIIRARLLEFLADKLKSKNAQQHLFLLPEIHAALEDGLPGLRQILALSTLNGLGLPTLASALNYIESLHTAAGSANFIQGLRDFFGAHTFERTDREGVFHAQWGGVEKVGSPE